MTPAGSLHRQPEAVRAFKARLAGLRRRRRFIHVRETGAYAADLRALLASLDPDLDPRTGVEAVDAFFRADAAVFEACDDSNGTVGDVFRFDARDKFVHYAARWDDKAAIADIVFDLLEDDGYGVRDAVLENAATYLPEAALRALADREWRAAGVVSIESGFRREYARHHRLILVGLIARQLNDPRLFERAMRKRVPALGTGAMIEIARSWLAAGEAEVALGWLDRVPEGERFRARERDTLLGAIYRRLGRSDDLERLLWRRFHASRTTDGLEELLSVIGEEKRERVVAEAAGAIERATDFSTLDATFLLECGRADDAARHVIRHREAIDGDYWGSLVPLVAALEKARRPLAATVVYRALLDSILKRAQTRTYGHGVRYLRRLAQLADEIQAWYGVPPHEDYVATLRERHGRKASFWKRASCGEPRRAR